MKRVLILVLCAALLATCAVNPVTGKKELSFYSEQGEIELGKETDKQVCGQYGVYGDAALSVYVSGVGNRMVPYSHRPQLHYSFQVLDTSVVNAFAAPGGYVYITRGALALINTESELAVILGHELGHVAARHTIRRMSEMILIQVGLAVAGSISKTLAEISGVASIGVQLLYLKFSRDDENQADSLGVQYSRGAGYNPGQMVNFFASLQRMGDMSGQSSLPGFLSTHPLNGERIQNITKMLTAADASLAVKRDAYLQSINNIVYGNDPRQGYVENNAFYHPGQRFVFEIPAGWKAQNTPSQVTLVSQDEQAALVLGAEKSAEDLKTYAGRKATELQGGQLLGEQSLLLNGLSSYHRLYDLARQDSSTLRVRLSFISKAGFIYTLAAVSTASTFGTYDTSFQKVLRSFKVLTDAAHINRAPRRLKLVRAGGGQTLQALFQASGMPKDSWANMALLNEMELKDVPKSGQWLKIIQ